MKCESGFNFAIASQPFQSDVVTLFSRSGKLGYCCGCGLVTSCGTGLVFGRTQFSLFNNPAQQLHPAFDQCCLIRFWSNLTPQRALINCHWEWTKGQVRALPKKVVMVLARILGWNEIIYQGNMGGRRLARYVWSQYQISCYRHFPLEMPNPEKKIKKASKKIIIKSPSIR